MKQIFLSILFLTNLVAFAQTESLTKEYLDKAIQPLKVNIQTLQKENGNLKFENNNLNIKILNANKRIDSLRNQTQENKISISKTASDLGGKIKENGDKNEGKISEVSNSLSKNSLIGIIGVLSAILLSGFLYWIFSKRQQIDKTDFTDQLNRTKSSIEESLVKEFGKQTELMDSLLKLIEQQKSSSQEIPNADPDHSLALKVASEINLIERNIKLMDLKTKGLKQLQASVGKLKDNLSANGYEMPEMLGKQFHQGLKVIVTSSIPDENLEKGQEIISKILIPAVMYNDKMIQTAQIEVSVG